MTAGELEILSREVMDLIKTIVGIEVFSSTYANCQKKTLDKKTERKKRKAENVTMSIK